MPYNSKGKWYNDPEAMARGSLAPAVYGTGTFSSPVFADEDAESVLATLNTHSFLTTGTANLALDWIARISGTSGDLVSITLASGTPTSGNASVTTTGAIAGPAITSFSAASTTGGGLVAGTTYFYKVTALNAFGESTPGAENSYLAPGSTSTNQISLNWGAVSGATGYNIYRSTVAGGESLLATVGAVTIYADANATPSLGSAPPAANTTAMNVVVTFTNAVATANDVLNAVRASQAASALLAVNLSSGSTGVTVVVAVGLTQLAGWTTSTVDVTLQTAIDAAGIYYTAGTFPQKVNRAAADPRAFGPVGVTSKWQAVVAGTTPHVAFSISALDHTLGMG